MTYKNLPITEQLNLSLPFIDELNTLDGIKLLLNDQLIAIKSIRHEVKNLSSIVDDLYKHFIKYKYGRIFYCGAGTSGRIGVQDGAELYPTFGWPKSRVKFIIAGGKQSLINSVENAEDDINDAINQVNNHNLSNEDVLIGLSASGNTPFTEKVLFEAFNKGTFVIAISNNPKGKMLNKAYKNVILNTSQEIIAGSTRLKAGTSQKICLNILSSMLMIKLGKVKKGQMVSLVANNKKLRIRKKNIEKYL